jgi:hypothetical protein
VSVILLTDLRVNSSRTLSSTPYSPVSKNQKAKRIRIVIMNPPDGHQAMTSLAHAKRYVARGRAEWDGGAIRFVHALRVHAHAGATLRDVPMRSFVCDSGQDGFLRYPAPMMVSGGVGRQFPALARMGGGM